MLSLSIELIDQWIGRFVRVPTEICAFGAFGHIRVFRTPTVEGALFYAINIVQCVTVLLYT